MAMDFRLTADNVINGFIETVSRKALIKISEIQYFEIVQDWEREKTFSILAVMSGCSWAVGEYQYDGETVTDLSAQIKAISDLRCFVSAIRGAE